MKFFSSFLVVYVTLVGISDSCTTQYGLRVKAYDDMKISQSVMWTMNNLTKAECLAECYKDKYCVSVQFSPLEPVCVALRERFDGVPVSSTPSSSYQLFQTTKPLSAHGSDCEFDVDCVSLTDANCHEGHCKCDIGYGQSGRVCRNLTECRGFADNFTMYARSFISGNDIEESSGITSSECMQVCLNNPSCVSADYKHTVSGCYLHQNTWFDLPVEDRYTNDASFDFYQRDC